jgi:2-iminoacetate synthase ThiH
MFIGGSLPSVAAPLSWQRWADCLDLNRVAVGEIQASFHRATKTVRIEGICRSFKHFSQKHADHFVPLPYQPENNDIPVQTPPTGFDALLTIAVSRIYLDNFDHITAYWVGLGLKLAQVALSYGADDLHGTIIEEHIFHMAGATSPQLQTEADMIKAIREAGRTPVQRNTLYEPIRVLENATAANEAESRDCGSKSKVLEDNLATA